MSAGPGHAEQEPGPGPAEAARRALRVGRERAAARPREDRAAFGLRTRPHTSAAAAPGRRLTFRPDEAVNAGPPSEGANGRLPLEAGEAGRGGEASRAGEAGWCGQAWAAVLADGPADPARQERGREYAGTGKVDTVTLAPGLVQAYVRGARPRPYRTELRLPTLAPTEWAPFFDAAVKDPATVEALLAGGLPQSLAGTDTPLLPRPEEVRCVCGCPDPEEHCKHAAALWLRTAQILTAEPLALLHLRGLSAAQLREDLVRRGADPGGDGTERPERRSEGAPAVGRSGARSRLPVSEVPPLAGHLEEVPGLSWVSAAAALARRPSSLPLPPPLPAPSEAGLPPQWAAVEGGPDPVGLDTLATDAAERARAWLLTGRDPFRALTPVQDAARIAAALPGAPAQGPGRSVCVALAEATGQELSELIRSAEAWRQGGSGALAALEELWYPPAGRFDRARPALLAAGYPAFRPQANRLTHPAGHAQLRLGRDGLWYAYTSVPGDENWRPTGAPHTGPVAALSTVATAAPGGD